MPKWKYPPFRADFRAIYQAKNFMTPPPQEASEPDRGLPQPKRRKLKPKDNPLLVAIALVLGFSGAIANSILMGNIAYFGLSLGLSNGVTGWFFGIFAILVSCLNTLTGLGAIFIPQQTLAALRLMTLAGLGSLVAGLLLFFLGIHLLALAGTAMACFWLSASATYSIRRQRFRDRARKGQHS
ncbi:MAG: hypothetical protein SVX43_00255 [Cyanobacteriota bacterium]|nr:hypothetical protein [Cyanobacteriota bacterium]